MAVAVSLNNCWHKDRRRSDTGRFVSARKKKRRIEGKTNFPEREKSIWHRRICMLTRQHGQVFLRSTPALIKFQFIHDDHFLFPRDTLLTQREIQKSVQNKEWRANSKAKLNLESKCQIWNCPCRFVSLHIKINIIVKPSLIVVLNFNFCRCNCKRYSLNIDKVLKHRHSTKNKTIGLT